LEVISYVFVHLGLTFSDELQAIVFFFGKPYVWQLFCKRQKNSK